MADEKEELTIDGKPLSEVKEHAMACKARWQDVLAKVNALESAVTVQDVEDAYAVAVEGDAQ